MVFAAGGQTVQAIDVTNSEMPCELGRLTAPAAFPGGQDDAHDLVYHDGHLFVTAQNLALARRRESQRRHPSPGKMTFVQRMRIQYRPRPSMKPALLTLTALLLAPLAALHAADAARSNIVHMLADDLGWGESAVEVNPGKKPTTTKTTTP